MESPTYRYYACVEDPSKKTYTCQLVESPAQSSPETRVSTQISLFLDPLILSYKLKAPVSVLPFK